MKTSIRVTTTVTYVDVIPFAGGGNEALEDAMEQARLVRPDEKSKVRGHLTRNDYHIYKHVSAIHDHDYREAA